MHVPSKTWMALAGGVLPFGALFMQAHFVLTALWQHRSYAAFGYLLAALCLTAVLTAEAAVVLTYFSLTGEEWRWHWRAFLAGGSNALYLAAYCLAFALLGPLNLVGGAGVVMYTLYSALMCVAAFVAGGALGLCASAAFVRVLYSSLKSE